MKRTAVTCAHLLVVPHLTLVDAELGAATELDATTWRSDLGCTQRVSGRGGARCGGA
jgi:hypothetical protein